MRETVLNNLHAQGVVHSIDIAGHGANSKMLTINIGGVCTACIGPAGSATGPADTETYLAIFQALVAVALAAQARGAKVDLEYVPGNPNIIHALTLYEPGVEPPVQASCTSD